MSKLLSGRYILTLTAAAVFAVLSFNGKIDPKDAMSVIVMTFTLYFTRNDRQPTGGQNV